MSNDHPSPQTTPHLLELLYSGRYAECEAAAAGIISRHPDFGLAWKVMGIALQSQGKPAQAFPALYRAAELLPLDAEAQGNLGLALIGADEAPAALAFLQRALELNPEEPNGWNNLGHGLCRLGRLEAAETHQRKALELQPESPVYQYNLGSILHDRGRLDEAMAWYNKALANAPLLAHAHWSLGMAKLQLGDFVAGWVEYEWRCRVPSFIALRANYQGIRWTGEQDINGKRLLLYAEQGLGDALQFCRYAELLATRGAHVILHVPSTLVKLLQTLPGVAEVHDQANDTPEHLFYCPMMSLPLAVGSEVDIPSYTPYLQADATSEEQWRQRLEPQNKQHIKPRIGICWSGQPGHKHDYRRSIALAQFLDLVDEQCDFICLQKRISSTEAELLDKLAQCRRFDTQLNDLADTAALIAQLDLVVTVDTAVAHLAGALGKPTWLLLSANADWRWLEGRSDSPWYPSMRIFRQSEAADWGGLLREVRRQLQLEFS